MQCGVRRGAEASWPVFVSEEGGRELVLWCEAIPFLVPFREPSRQAHLHAGHGEAGAPKADGVAGAASPRDGDHISPENSQLEAASSGGCTPSMSNAKATTGPIPKV